VSGQELPNFHIGIDTRRYSPIDLGDQCISEQDRRIALFDSDKLARGIVRRRRHCHVRAALDTTVVGVNRHACSNSMQEPAMKIRLIDSVDDRNGRAADAHLTQ
jgi:hypothetical protein